jgi:hypothetical protein
MTIITERQKEILADLEIGTEPEVVENPYSGVSCTLEPVAVALHDYIKGCEMFGDYKNMQEAIMLFRINWPDEYYKLLD